MRSKTTTAPSALQASLQDITSALSPTTPGHPAELTTGAEASTHPAPRRVRRGWLVRLQSEQRAAGQSLVAPFPVARAQAADGHALSVRDGNRVVLPAIHGATAVVIVPARAKVNRSGDPTARAFRQAATRLPRQLTRLSSSKNVCR